MAAKFQLSYDPSTLAMVVLSQPAMFERTFLPFLAEQELDLVRDPVDQCMLQTMATVTARHPAATVLHDFQLLPSRRPAVLVQTAGHVAAAARFLLPSEVPGLEGEQGKLFPVSHHPTWGGWFAIRAVIVFQDR